MKPITYGQIFRQLRQRIAMSIAGKQPQLKGFQGKRGYSGARQNRLFADWLLSVQTGDASLQNDVLTLRNRCRDMDGNNPWITRFLDACEDNILKPKVGFSLQMKCAFPPDFKNPDQMASDKIELAWAEWSKAKNCTLNGDANLFEVCRQSLRSRKRDGGIMIRKIRDPGVNKFAFTLSMIEIDHLDHNYTTSLEGGNYVVMGVEKNRNGKVLAYHLLENHPGDLLFGGIGRTGYRIRVPANEIIHYYKKQRVTQSIGVPEISPVVVRQRHLDEYEKAELVASREAAIKGGYFTSTAGDSYAGEKEETASGEETGATLDDQEPGQNDELPPGMSFVPYDPQHPTSQYGEFLKHSLLGTAAGLGISYMTLTGDLSQANYSSMRSGSLNERKGWIKDQEHMIEHLILPIFEVWLEASILSGGINLPYSKFEQFNRPSFSGCRWEWVDPRADVDAALKEIDGGLSTRTKWCEERGIDFEETCATLAYEKQVEEDNDLEFVSANKPPTPEPASEPAQTPDAAESENNTSSGSRNGHKLTLPIKLI